MIIFLPVLASEGLAETKVIINENSRASVSTGGNVIEGTGPINTGSANASTSSKTTLRSSESKAELEVHIDTEAEANGKKANASMDEKNNQGKTERNVSKENSGGLTEVSVETDTSSDNPNSDDFSSSPEEFSQPDESQNETLLNGKNEIKENKTFSIINSIIASLESLIYKIKNFLG